MKQYRSGNRDCFLVEKPWITSDHGGPDSGAYSLYKKVFNSTGKLAEESITLRKWSSTAVASHVFTREGDNHHMGYSSVFQMKLDKLCQDSAGENSVSRAYDEYMNMSEESRSSHSRFPTESNPAVSTKNAETFETRCSCH